MKRHLDIGPGRNLLRGSGVAQIGGTGGAGIGSGAVSGSGSGSGAGSPGRVAAVVLKFRCLDTEVKMA